MSNKVLIKNYCRFRIDEGLVARVFDKELKKNGLEDKVELSMVIVGRKRAQGLNKNYRNKNYIPQMLEFPMSKEKDEDGWIRLGDIMLCWELVLKDTRKFNKSVAEILTEWAEHGIGNLLK
jgi:rRNA maturation RNase YbeY